MNLISDFLGVSLRSHNKVKITCLSLIHCSQVTYSRHLDVCCLWIQSVCMSTPPFVIFVTLLLTFTCIDFRVPILRTRLFLRVHSISYPTHDPERTTSKPFTRLIGLRHVTKSGWQNVLLTFSSFKKPRHLKIIYIQNRSCYCLMASGK